MARLFFKEKVLGPTMGGWGIQSHCEKRSFIHRLKEYSNLECQDLWTYQQNALLAGTVKFIEGQGFDGNLA